LHPGKVLLTGNSSISFSGEYIHIRDFVFQQGGYGLKNKPVIEFRTAEKQQANHCVVSGCVIDAYNNAVKTDVNTWVGLYGEYNKLERCLFKAKDNMGPTVVVWLEAGRPAHHTISDNYFLGRTNGPQVDNGLETIRIGDSKTSFTDAHCVVAFNRFEDCDGEIEIISNKSGHNSYFQNTFFHCDGGLTLRHGNYALCDGNYFDGGNKQLSYGIRFIGEGHVAINNYFTNLHGSTHEAYRSPVSVLNGLINTPLNGYYPVKRAVISDNVFVNCEPPLIRIGAFSPKREGMSIAPDSVTVARNLFINQPALNAAALEIITFPTNFRLVDNLVAGLQANTGIARLITGTAAAIKAQTKKITASKDAGADWIDKAIAERLGKAKYSYVSASAVGPAWMR
jgi:poly(beta-D-mannuronate) lyase